MPGRSRSRTRSLGRRNDDDRRKRPRSPAGGGAPRGGRRSLTPAKRSRGEQPPPPQRQPPVPSKQRRSASIDSDRTITPVSRRTNATSSIVVRGKTPPPPPKASTATKTNNRGNNSPAGGRGRRRSKTPPAWSKKTQPNPGRPGARSPVRQSDRRANSHSMRRASPSGRRSRSPPHGEGHRGQTPRRVISPPRRAKSSPRQANSLRRGNSPPRRANSPPRRARSSPRRSPPRSLPRRTPPRRANSPPRRAKSSPRRGISPRRANSLPRRGKSSPRRSPPRRATSQPRRRPDSRSPPRRSPDGNRRSGSRRRRSASKRPRDGSKPRDGSRPRDDGGRRGGPVSGALAKRPRSNDNRRSPANRRAGNGGTGGGGKGRGRTPSPCRSPSRGPRRSVPTSTTSSTDSGESSASRDKRLRYPDFANPRRGSTFLQKRADGQLVLYDRYIFVQALGKGTFSKVAEVVDTTTGNRVAMKVFRASERYQEACNDELQILTKLQTEAARTYVAVGKDFRSTFAQSVGHEFARGGLTSKHLPSKAKPPAGGGSGGKAAGGPAADDFTADNHCALLFPLAGPSVYDVIKANGSRGFSVDIVRSIAGQMLLCLQLCEKAGIVHTDIKPENVLFLSRESHTVGGQRVPLHSAITVIDFGNAVETANFASESHNRKKADGPSAAAKQDATAATAGSAATTSDCLSRRLIQTRHYRAPEVIFESGWSLPADLWSVGCLLPELLTGQCLFMVHEDGEHLAMMEQILGTFTRRELNLFAGGDRFSELVSSQHKLRWPERGVPARNVDAVRKLAPLQSVLADDRPGHCELLDLARKLLQYDPKWRPTAAQALEHPFFKS